ncbi:MAG: glycosyltransferase [Candidatus Rifleibacteriota bacterium]
MKIIQIINALTYGGAQILLFDLAKHLEKENHQVLILAFRDGPVGEKLRQNGFTTIILGEKILDLPAFYQLIHIIKKFEPDLIHSHLFRATFWARLCRLIYPDLKLVTSIHGCETEVFHQFEKLTHYLSHKLIFPSHFLKNWYFKNIGRAANTEVIYPGVKLESSANVQNNSIPLIGTLSRLHPVKGIDCLLKACAILKAKDFAFRLLIGGDGTQKKQLEKTAQSLGLNDICQFSGPITNSRKFLAKLDIFIAPSRREAFGINVCEAMEQEIPVIASSVGGLTEIIQNNKNGFLIEPDNAQQLAQTIARLISEPENRKAIGLAARQRIITNFNRNKAMTAHIKIYNNFLPSKMRVHFVVSSQELGGGERLALSLISYLKAKNIKVSATCCPGKLSKKLEMLGIEHSTASLKFGGLFFILKLFKDLKNYRPSIISSHLNKASLFAGISRLFYKIPVVSHVHGLNKLFYYSSSDHLITVSKSICAHLIRQGAGPNKITVVPNSVKLQAKPPRKLDPEKRLKVCIIAKLHKNKGHFWALKAILQNSTILPNLEIHLIGEGPEEQNLKTLAAKGKFDIPVIFHGFVSNPCNLIEEMDIALLPSLGEGIPLSLLEAMSFAIPCVATNVGGIPEIITHNKNGILIESKDDTNLVKTLQQLAKPDFYNKLSAGAHEEFIRINNHDKMLTNTLKVFAKFWTKADEM